MSIIFSIFKEKNIMETYKVYEIINSMGTVEYVGQSIDPIRRFYQHTRVKPSVGSGSFYKRSDIILNIVAEFNNRKDALVLENKLQKEWNIKTDIQKYSENGLKQGRMISKKEELLIC